MKNLVPLDEFCLNHQIEFSFMKNLRDFGMVEVIIEEDIEYLNENQIASLEKMLRLHRELDINLEGIDTITHLLRRIEHLQQEIIGLKNRLNLYE